MIQCSIVVDLGFGDAGKGLTTDYLAAQNPDQNLVIRFSGGHQVGHTVTTPSHTHTFSNFGSGTLQGVPTWYSQHTTIFPPAILLEKEHLLSFSPKLFLHPLVMVTTPYDIAFNRALEKITHHGSCGLGFGATIERNRNEVFFFAQDLSFDWVMEQRLQSIDTYYQSKIKSLHNPTLLDCYKKEVAEFSNQAFISSCRKIRDIYTIAYLEDLKSRYSHFIFEGSQGIMLDTRHGIYPHTTWSYTTSSNALALIRETCKEKLPAISIYYVTRCYQTRHGEGPMSSRQQVTLQNNENESNVENEFQGKFRTAILDPDLITYALICDQIYHQGFDITKNLVITCLDQLPGFSVANLIQKLPYTFNEVLGSYGPKGSDLVSINR